MNESSNHDEPRESPEEQAPKEAPQASAPAKPAADDGCPEEGQKLEEQGARQPEETVAPTKPVRKKSRLLLKALLVGALLFAVFVVAGVLSYERILTWYVIRTAQSRGVQIDPKSIQVSSSRVLLRDTRVSLIGVPSISVRAEVVEVGLEGLSPTNADVRGVALDVQGSPPVVLRELSAWAQAHKSESDLPLRLEGVEVLWRDRPKEQPWLSVHKATIAPMPGGPRLRAAQVVVAGVALSKVSALWRSDKPEIVIAVGTDDPLNASVRVELARNAPFAARAVWKLTPLQDLGALFGAALSMRGVSAEGSLELRFSEASSVSEGSVHLVLQGYVPPHPAELNSIVYGDKTVIDSKLALSEDRAKATLTGLKVVAGAFQLEGSGQLQILSGYGLLSLRLSGSIPCSSLAVSAAQGRLGPLVGGLVGGLASGRLTGAITVGVGIEADTRNLAGAKITDTLGGGCRLQLL